MLLTNGIKRGEVYLDENDHAADKTEAHSIIRVNVLDEGKFKVYSIVMLLNNVQIAIDDRRFFVFASDTFERAVKKIPERYRDAANQALKNIDQDQTPAT